MKAILNLFEQKVNDVIIETGGCAEHVSYMLCGDFNSSPYSGVVQLMLQGRIPANHSDWYSSKC